MYVCVCVHLSVNKRLMLHVGTVCFSPLAISVLNNHLSPINLDQECYVYHGVVVVTTTKLSVTMPSLERLLFPPSLLSANDISG